MSNEGMLNSRSGLRLLSAEAGGKIQELAATRVELSEKLEILSRALEIERSRIQKLSCAGSSFRHQVDDGDAVVNSRELRRIISYITEAFALRCHCQSSLNSLNNHENKIRDRVRTIEFEMQRQEDKKELIEERIMMLYRRTSAQREVLFQSEVEELSSWW